MAIRQLRMDDDPILRKQCKEVKIIDDKIKGLLDDMMDTLHSTANDAALAAPQIGILKQLVVVDMDGYVLKMINPKIISSEGLQDCIEGCLSFPNRFGKTTRPEKVTVEYLDFYRVFANHLLYAAS